MVNRIIQYLFPALDHLRDYALDDFGNIVKWNVSKLGPQPDSSKIQTIQNSPEFQTWFLENGGDSKKTLDRICRESIDNNSDEAFKAITGFVKVIQNQLSEIGIQINNLVSGNTASIILVKTFDNLKSEAKVEISK